MKVYNDGPIPLVQRLVGLAVIGLTILAASVFSPACVTAADIKQVVHLYFADPVRPFLVAEERVMVHPGDPARFGRQLVEAVINGPADGGKLPTLARQARVRAFFLLEDGTAVVDFSSVLREKHPGGCRWEQLALFSLVNSLVLNEPAIERVKILIAGAEHETLAGHVPIEFSLTADMRLTR